VVRGVAVVRRVGDNGRMSAPTVPHARAWGLTPRVLTMSISALVTFVLLLVMLTQPVPYAVQQPGPTVDTLGEQGDVELITVTGTPTYPTSGELLLTTVTTAGGPAFPVEAGYVLRGWLAPSVRVAPVEAFFDPTLTQDQLDAQSSQQMIGSQENATVAALTDLGYDVPATLTIVGTDARAGGAADVVEDGDVIASIGAPERAQTDVVTFAELSEALADTAPGSTVTLGVERDGELVELPVVTGDDGRGGSTLGVFLAGDFDYPVDVTIQIDNIGGPSAGTMFALGIIDRLTPGEMTGGHVVAGTGTMSLGGLVGPIGGIQQKLIGARDAGAEYFLAPTANCGEVVGHVPDGLQVVEISTLADARAAVEAIGEGETADLPTC
jgi:Lon-like protease